MVRGYRTELDLNNEQKTACMKHAGTSRFAYNWGLARSKEVYRTTGKRPTAVDLHRELNALKQTGFPWMYETSKLSDGTTFENPRALKHALKKLKRLERQKSRRKKGSANRKKTCRKLAKQHARVATIRKDATHKLTTYLCKNHTLVAIEDLHVAGMLKNHCLAQAVSDANFGEIRRQLEYKAEWYSTRLVAIDRFYPSSKTCSGCGYIKPELSLSERTFVCEDCGMVLDRDLNAALNVRMVAVSSIDT